MCCSAVSCSSRTTKGGIKNPELSFHTFPKSPEIRREWIKAVRRDNWEPTKYSRLCSKHFDISCFIVGLSIKKLKTDAVPTIFEGYPVYYQPAVKRRKPSQRPHEILNDIPRKLKKMQESDDIPTTHRRAVRDVRALSQSRAVALKRLRTIKKLRESKRRLVKKNATLVNVLNGLKYKNLMDTESLDLLSSISGKTQDLLVRLKRKSANEPVAK